MVDGSSTDKTREIAISLDARVIKTTNKPIFHINKQLAIDEARYEIVLQLDADEVVDGELAAFIKRLDRTLDRCPDKVKESAWWIKRKNNFLGHWLKKGGQYPDPVIRLFLKGKAWLPQRSVHEQMEVEGEIGWADGHLLHYSNPQFKDYWRKLQAYTKLEALQLESHQQPITVKLLANYLLWQPLKTFFLIFVRHKGFVDGVYGLLFALLSALHFPITLAKYIALQSAKK